MKIEGWARYVAAIGALVVLAQLIGLLWIFAVAIWGPGFDQ
jgi:hypothetical protein